MAHRNAEGALELREDVCQMPMVFYLRGVPERFFDYYDAAGFQERVGVFGDAGLVIKVMGGVLEYQIELRFCIGQPSHNGRLVSNDHVADGDSGLAKWANRGGVVVKTVDLGIGKVFGPHANRCAVCDPQLRGREGGVALGLEYGVWVAVPSVGNIDTLTGIVGVILAPDQAQGSSALLVIYVVAFHLDA